MAVEKGVECYERLKGGRDGSPVRCSCRMAIRSRRRSPRNPPRQDPAAHHGYGRTEAIDGRVFPYSFTALFSFWSEASSAVNYIAEQVGGKDKLKGLKIATVYHDSPYGKETQVPLDLLAKTYGFENIQIAVPHPATTSRRNGRASARSSRTGSSCAAGA